MNSINSKPKEQSSGQNSTEEANKEIYLNEEIAGHYPLRIVGVTNQGYCIVFGKYRISEIKPTEKEAMAELNLKTWEIIINLIAAVTGQTDALKDRIK